MTQGNPRTAPGCPRSAAPVERAVQTFKSSWIRSSLPASVYFIGCGTSYHACLAGSVYFAQLAKKTAIPVLAPQFIPQYLPAVTSEDVGIFVSQSGETKDVLNALQAAEASGMTCFAMANVIGSTLTRATVPGCRSPAAMRSVCRPPRPSPTR